MNKPDREQSDENTKQSAVNQNSVTCPNCAHANPSWRSKCENCDQDLRANGTARTNTTAKINKTPKPQKDESGLCQKCNTRSGDPYTFHYLKKIVEGNAVKLSHYKDGGTETALICDTCVNNHRKKELLQFGLLFLFFLATALIALGFFIAILIRSSTFSAILLASGGVLTVLAVGSAQVWHKTAQGGLKVSGTSLAIDIWKKWLVEQGYDTFLYENEYIKLKTRV